MNGRRVTSKNYSNAQLYDLSQKIIATDDRFFDNAYSPSYTDGYDFCSKKRSLKKLERELGITHKYTSLPWDPVWHKIAVWIRRSFRRFGNGYYGKESDIYGKNMETD